MLLVSKRKHILKLLIPATKYIKLNKQIKSNLSALNWQFVCAAGDIHIYHANLNKIKMKPVPILIEEQTNKK